MTHSLPTVRYMQANYRRYQILAVACALLTILASLLAAFSGIRLNSLRKELASAATGASQARAVAAAGELATTRQALTEAQAQLDVERKQIEGLRQRIGELEHRLTATDGKPVSKTSPTVTEAPSLQTPESDHAVHAKPYSDTAVPPPKTVAPMVTHESDRNAAMPSVQRRAPNETPVGQQRLKAVPESSALKSRAPVAAQSTKAANESASSLVPATGRDSVSRPAPSSSALPPQVPPASQANAERPAPPTTTVAPVDGQPDKAPSPSSSSQGPVQQGKKTIIEESIPPRSN